MDVTWTLLATSRSTVNSLGAVFCAVYTHMFSPGSPGWRSPFYRDADFGLTPEGPSGSVLDPPKRVWKPASGRDPLRGCLCISPFSASFSGPFLPSVSTW